VSVRTVARRTGALGAGRRRPWVALLAAVSAATFLQWTGASAVLPELPVYLHRRGTSELMIGVIIAAYFAGAFGAQYLAGRVADRVGYRPVLLAGLIGYAIAAAGFVLDPAPWGYAGLRAAQGAAAGAAQVAGLALVARQVPRRVRGRAFAVVYGAELGGMATGPLAGTALGMGRMTLLFVGAAAGALLACLPVLALRRDVPPAPGGVRGPGSAAPGRLEWSGRRGRLLAGVLCAAAFGGLMTGTYESCWSLLLAARGAAPWQIGASWTLFAVPFVVMSPLAGWLADHRDRRTLVVLSSASSVAFCAVYSVLPDPGWLLALGTFEAVGVAVALPAAQALLADAVPEAASGHAQGVFASVTTAAVAVVAPVAGALFGVAPWLPFAAGAALGTLLVGALPLVWRGIDGAAPGAAPRPPGPDPAVTVAAGTSRG